MYVRARELTGILTAKTITSKKNKGRTITLEMVNCNSILFSLGASAMLASTPVSAAVITTSTVNVTTPTVLCHPAHHHCPED